MAQKVQVVLVDDLDGGPADTTVAFAWGGASYEIDLSEANAARFADLVAPYVGHARRVGPARRATRRGSAGRVSSDAAAIRAWAREQGIEVNERGRVRPRCAPGTPPRTRREPRRRDDGTVLDDDPGRLDIDRVFRWLSLESYWAVPDTLERSLAGSWAVGAYAAGTERGDAGADAGEMVALTRVVTDHATFAYLCDVVVDADHRQRHRHLDGGDGRGRTASRRGRAAHARDPRRARGLPQGRVRAAARPEPVDGAGRARDPPARGPRSRSVNDAPDRPVGEQGSG